MKGTNMTTLPGFNTLLYEKETHILTITLNRPESLNSFNADMLADLSQAVEIASNDKDIRIVVFTAAGRVFSCGGDLRNMVNNQTLVEADSIEQGIKYVQGIFDRIEAIPKPTIAAINGHAVGAGFQLTLACDFRIASTHAKLGVNDLKIGILPALGATTRLPLLIGLAKAKELILLGELITPMEAFEIGLINRVVEREDLDATVNELIDKLLTSAPLALAAAKDLLDSESSLDEAAVMQSFLIKSADAGEGIAAFFEKRRPCFKGH
jgi:enoyl-CoA hydratase/carnithine racemase